MWHWNPNEQSFQQLQNKRQNLKQTSDRLPVFLLFYLSLEVKWCQDVMWKEVVPTTGPVWQQEQGCRMGENQKRTLQRRTRKWKRVFELRPCCGLPCELHLCAPSLSLHSKKEGIGRHHQTVATNNYALLTQLPANSC